VGVAMFVAEGAADCSLTKGARSGREDCESMLGWGGEAGVWKILGQVNGDGGGSNC
jgi:hypothetical protein